MLKNFFSVKAAVRSDSLVGLFIAADGCAMAFFLLFFADVHTRVELRRAAPEPFLCGTKKKKKKKKDELK